MGETSEYSYTFGGVSSELRDLVSVE